METAAVRAITRPAAARIATARVLLIDDDEHFRVLARNLLAPAGIELTEAANARQGMTLIRKASDVDVVILDLVLPDENGIQLLRRIKKNYPRVKIIAMSGAFTADFYLTLSAQLGADAVLPKTQLHRLRQRLENLLDARG
jgi:CheY-like chemotaxis protein